MIDFFSAEIAERTLFGVTLLTWLFALGLWAAYGLGLVLIQRFLVWRLGKLAAHTVTTVDDILVEVFRKTRTYFLVALGLYLAVITLALPERIISVVGRITFIVLLLQVIRWGSSMITLWIDRYKARKLETDAAAVTTMQAVGFVARLALWSIVLLLALANFGVDITALVAGLGVGGIAVALAVQNILGDLFSSLSIVLDKPFVVGDFLIVNEYLGTVEHIGLKTTRLRSLSGEQIIFANSDLLKSRIRNYKRMYERRVVFTVGVTYQTPHEQLEEIAGMLREAVEAQDQVRFDRAHFKEYGDFALVYEVVYYVLDPDFNLYMDKQQAINLTIHRRFEEEGIEFAYPTQTLYVSQVSADGASVASDISSS